MGAFLLALAPLLAGITEPLKNWLGYKQKEIEAKQDLALAVLKAQSEQAIAVVTGEVSQTRARLGATSQNFKQTTWWFLSLIVLYSIIFRDQAAQMWANFALIPQWFQYLYLSVFSVIWGLPIAKDNMSLMFSSVKNAIADRREFKIEKIKAFNKEAAYVELRKELFTKGMTQKQVDIFEKVFKAGQEE